MRRAVVAVSLLSACGQVVPSHQVVVGTDTAQEQAQYQADVAYLAAYQPQCTSTGQNPRVLVTGYGRFLTNSSNASGLVVSTFLPAAAYPFTNAAPDGQVDDPAAQVSVGSGTVALPLSGNVDVCAMILPVYWGLAPALVMREIDQFAPNFVMMNGIDAYQQPLYLELGSVNSSDATPDGSNLLSPPPGSPLLPEAAAGLTDPLLLSWTTVQQAAIAAIGANASTADGNTAFSDDVLGVDLAGFPRASNTYLCNNITFDLDYAMDHPGQTVTLLQPSTAFDGGGSGVVLGLANDYSAVPRVFVHWPSALSGNLLGAGANVMSAIIDSQLNALANGPAPTRGDNAIAQITQ